MNEEQEKLLLKIISDLTIETNDIIPTTDVINLDDINLCDPDNMHNFNMPYPHLPDNIEDISNILNSSPINDLLNIKNFNGLFGNNFSPDIKDIINTAKEQIKTLTPDNSLLDENNTNVYNHPIENFAIIEFGDDYTLGEAVEYELFVLPGDTINQNTIIGTVVLNGVKKNIRSIFEKATVVKNQNNDFFRLFPSNCNRHIVITDYAYSSGTSFNIDKITEFTDRYKDSVELFNLIKDNLCYSTLPQILLRRETDDEHHINVPLIGRIVHPFCPYDNGKEVYAKFTKIYEEGLDKILREFLEICSEKNIKATKGNSKLLLALFDIIMKKRDELLLWVITYYNLSKHYDKCKYDSNYEDCRYLAWGTNGEDLRLSNSLLGSSNVGSTKYANYYFQILSRISLTTNNKYAWKYYRLISDIISNRLNIELYSIVYLISEFNQLFYYNVNKDIDGAYVVIDLLLKNKEELEYNDVLKSILSFAPEGTTAENYGSKTANTTAYSIYQLANIFWFIKHYNGPVNNSLAANSNTWDVTKLIQEEANKLNNFWEEIITLYFKKETFEDITKEYKEYAESLNKDAEWPAAITIPIEGRSYKLYEFANPLIVPEEPEEDAVSADYEINSTMPPQPTTAPIPTDVPANYPAMFSDNDPKRNEITVKDYAYWVKYFSLATLISIPFLADGLDIPTPGGLVPIPLPCIWICFNAIYIKPLDIVLVIGLGLRGIYPWPVLLGVNLSSNYASIMTPLISLLKIVHDLFCSLMEKLELTIPNLLQIIINKLEAENIELRKRNNEFNAYQEALKAQAIENKALIRKGIRAAYSPTSDFRQVYTRLENLKNAAVGTYQNTTAKL